MEVFTHDEDAAPLHDHINQFSRNKIAVLIHSRRPAQVHFDLESCERKKRETRHASQPQHPDSRMTPVSHLPLPLPRRKTVPPSSRACLANHVFDSRKVTFVVHPLNHVLQSAGEKDQEH